MVMQGQGYPFSVIKRRKSGYAISYLVNHQNSYKYFYYLIRLCVCQLLKKDTYQFLPDLCHTIWTQSVYISYRITMCFIVQGKFLLKLKILIAHVCFHKITRLKYIYTLPEQTHLPNTSAVVQNPPMESYLACWPTFPHLYYTLYNTSSSYEICAPSMKN